MISKPLVFFLLLFSIQVRAVDSSFFMDNYLLGGAQNVRDSQLNPGNRTLALSSQELEADIRPDETLKFNDDQFVKLRPRWVVPYGWTRFENPDENRQGGRGDLDLTDAYWDARWGAVFSTTVGLQVYQWGPAEIANFSNPLFHFNFNQRSIFYKEKGQALVRANAQWTSSFSQVFIAEPVANRAPLWREDEDFQSQFLLKSEYQWNSQNNLGLVLGEDEDAQFYFGEYGNWAVTDSWAIYADARHPYDDRPYAPEENQSGFVTLDRRDANDRFETIGVIGTRYQADKFDVRLEYVHNSSGWSADQLRASQRGVTVLSPWILDNSKRFSRTGLELPGRDYYYASIRVPDLAKVRDLTGFLRVFESLQDHSRIIQTSFEKPLNDAWTGYLEATLPLGGSQDELSFSTNGQLYAGAKYTFAR